jgi:hypothetical protein
MENIRFPRRLQVLELKKLEFEKSLQLRNFEIENFWKRGWFFGALIIAIGTGYFKVYKDCNSPAIYLSFMGFLISFLQCLMNRGSKYWQERWENKTKNKEAALGIDLTKTKLENERWLLDACTLAKNENFFTLSRRFSVSKLTFLVWDAIAILWGFLWVRDWRFSTRATIDWWAVAFHGAIFLYIVLFFGAKRFNTTLKTGKKDRIKWLGRFHLLRFKDGGGGKVYERFVRKYDDNPYAKGDNSHATNVDHRYYEDSEHYVKNDKNELIKMEENRKQIFAFFEYASKHLGRDVKKIIIRENGKDRPKFDELTNDGSQRTELEEYWHKLVSS